MVYPLFERYFPNLILRPVENSTNIKCGAVVNYFQAFGHRTPALIDTFIKIKDGRNQFGKLFKAIEKKTDWKKADSLYIINRFGCFF